MLAEPTTRLQRRRIPPRWHRAGSDIAASLGPVVARARLNSSPREVGHDRRGRGVEADDVEHAGVVRVGDAEAVGDQPTTISFAGMPALLAVLPAAPGPGGSCRPRSRCR